MRATVQQIRAAYQALTRIGQSTLLPAKAAWRVARLLNKLRPVVATFEETQLNLFLSAGGVQTDRAVEIAAPVRGDETDEAWAVRGKAHRDRVNKLNADLMELNKAEEDIDYDPLPLDVFGEDVHVSAIDFAELGPFLKE